MSDRDTFWKRLDGIQAGMLGCAPDWRLVPMSHNADPEESALWFFSAAGTDLVEAVEGAPQKAVHVLSSDSKNLYARIEGDLALVNDPAKIDELWNTVASSWYEDGKRDPDLRLLRLSISQAEVWATGGTMSFLYEIAKSKLTGAKPDMGEHFQVSFA